MLVNVGSSALAIAVVTAMHLIPAIVIAPISGSIIDRFSQFTVVLSIWAIINNMHKNCGQKFLKIREY